MPNKIDWDNYDAWLLKGCCIDGDDDSDLPETDGSDEYEDREFMDSLED